MAIKKINTDLQIEAGLLDGDGNSGTSNQILISTGTGIDWVDGSGSGIIGGPYLPLTGGTLTGNTNLTGSTKKLILKSGAQLGFEDAAPTGTIYLYNDGGATSKLNIGGTMWVEEAGNVGIGTTSPSFKLDVNGGAGTPLRLYSSADAQLLLNSPDSWTGIGFNDGAASGTDYIWHNGVHQTFAIGGGGSNVSGKKLHVHGATTIGSGLASTAVPTDGLLVQGNVGIRTTTPYANTSLHVAGSGTNPVLSAINPAQVGLIVSNSDVNYGTLFATNGSGIGLIQQRRTNNATYYALALNPYGGNVGIGTTSPAYKLDVRADDGDVGQVFIKGGNSTVTAVGEINSELLFGSNDVSVGQGNIGGKISSVTETTNGAYTGMAFYTYRQTSLLLTEKMRITNEGKVGIGTTNPNAKLTLKGSGLISQDFFHIEDSGGVRMLEVTSDPAGNANLQVKDTTGVTKSLINSAGNSYFNGGNVGIGTTDPGEKLEIIGKGTNNAVEIKLGTNTSSYKVTSIGQNDGNGTFEFGSYLDTYIVNRWTINDNGDLILGTNNQEQMRISHSGNVGIGTSLPQTKLHVEGLTRITEGGNTAFYSGDYVRLFNSQAYQFRNSGGSTIANINLNGNSYFNGGNVGIGTTNPLKKLSVNGGDIAVNNSNSFIVGAAITGNTQIGELGADSGQLQLLTESTRDIKFGSTTYGNIMFLEGVNGNVGIGTVSPNDKLDIFGNLRISYDASNYFTVEPISNGNVYFKPTGGSIHVAKTTKNNQIFLYDYTGASARWGEYDASSIVLKTSTNTAGIVLNTDGNSYINGGNVGIGTTSPFTIGGTAKLSLYASGPSTFGLSNTDAVYLRRYGVGRYQFQTTANGGNSGDLSLQSYGGNVGIGTTSPDYELEVDGDIRATSEIFWGHNSGSPVGRMYSGAQTGVVLNTANDGATVISGGNATSSGSNLALFGGTHATTPNEVRFRSGSTNTMLIASNGNVGIGTTSPNYKLDVNGDVRIESNHFLRFGGVGSGDENWVIQQSSGNLNFAEYAVADGRLYLKAGGNVGIGTTSPGSKLEVRGDSGSSALLSLISDSGTPNDAFMRFYDEGGGGAYSVGLDSGDEKFKIAFDYDGDSLTTGTKLVIDTSGNVGIGITSLSEKLEVSGNVKATNFILSSDASLKEDVKDLNVKVDAKWKSYKFKNEDEVRYGVIAQELEETNPELVKTNEEGLKSVKYIDLLIAKIAELEARLEKLEK